MVEIYIILSLVIGIGIGYAIANKNNKPTTIEVSPVLPPASTPAEL